MGKRGPKPGSDAARRAGERLKDRRKDPTFLSKLLSARKAAWADPAVRAKMSAARKAAWADPAVRAKMSAARKAALADPAVRAKMSAARKAAWADPAVRAKMDWLSPQQISEIVDEIKRNVRPYVEIAEDWLVSLGTIARIAREAGVQRRPRRQSRTPHVTNDPVTA